MRSTDVSDYAENMAVNFFVGIAEAASPHIQLELKRVLDEEEHATTTLLAGYVLGFWSALLLQAPSHPQSQQLQLPTQVPTIFNES